MRILITLTIAFYPGMLLYAQITPVTSSADQLMAENVKSVSAYYSSDTSTSNTEEYLILKREYDSNGKLIRQYQLYLWDVVSYSYTTTYAYNENGQVQEELKIQKILNLFKRDHEYIQTFGDKPLHEKIRYYYNEQGLLAKKEIYTFSTESVPENSEPSQSIEYFYEGPLLIEEESESSDERFFNRNYEIDYRFDSVGNMVQKIMNYGKDMDLKRTSTYTYDSLNRIVKERINDPSVPHNNAYYKYEYNNDGLLSQKYIFNTEEEAFELDRTYTYDEHGNAISGERNVEFEYYNNGLIKSESWTNTTTDELITFMTTYEYY